MIGSLFTLAGETLSAIGRMIERPAFINKVTFDTLQATREHDLHWSGGRNGRWESDGPDAADQLADFEANHDVLEPMPTDSNVDAFLKASAATPDARREGPNPATPPTGLGLQTSECPGCYDFACPGPHPTSPGASSVSQPAAAAVPGESVGATDSNFGGGVDRPLSEVLIEVCDVLRGLTSTPLSMTAWLSYRNDALMLVPVLLDAAAQLRDTE